ncbi:MAG: nucleotidyl transferase AbiEii/AbiGii toxin family protein [Candidatus Methanoperedens sp.]|nr:nucleotidyl transferase AbiEii/AbiGii toxin family protein [Candidatus Methanoperedens sp.]
MDENDLRRRARKTGFNVATLEKDYALTWLLSGIYREDSKLRDLLIFKGGTAIRKIYFPEWRLSEDMDFTIMQEVDPLELKQGFEQVFSSVYKKSSINYSFTSFNAGEYAIFADVQFLGPIGFKNKIAHDISLKEKMVEKPQRIKVKPEYEDITEFEVLVYSPNEILVEKLRSILQRGKARDYYDVWGLMKEKEFNPDKIRELIILKCQITGIEFNPVLIFDENRLSEAKKFWTVALARLTKNLPDFESVVKDLRLMLDFMKVK